MSVVAGAEQKYPTFDVFWWTFGFMVSGFSWLAILTKLGWTIVPLMYIIPIVVGFFICDYLTDMNKVAVQARLDEIEKEKEQRMQDDLTLVRAAKDAVAIALEINWRKHYKGYCIDRDIDMYIHTLNNHIAWGRFTNYF